MAALLNNRWFVGSLALLAAFVVYRQVAVPLLDDGGGAVVLAPTPEDIDDVIDFSDDPGIETVAQGLQFVTAQYDLQSVSVDALHWNEDPTRDPFAPKVVIDTDDVTAVQDKISDVAPVSVRTPEPATPPPVIAAVVSGNDVQYAVVDGEIIKPGDRIGPWRLVAVERDAAVFADTRSARTRRVRIQQ